MASASLSTAGRGGAGCAGFAAASRVGRRTASLRAARVAVLPADAEAAVDAASADVAWCAADDDDPFAPEAGVGSCSVFVASGAGVSIAGCAVAGFFPAAESSAAERGAGPDVAARVVPESFDEGVPDGGDGALLRSCPISAASFVTIALDDATTPCPAARAHAPARISQPES